MKKNYEDGVEYPLETGREWTIGDPLEDSMPADDTDYMNRPPLDPEKLRIAVDTAIGLGSVTLKSPETPEK